MNRLSRAVACVALLIAGRCACMQAQSTSLAIAAEGEAARQSESVSTVTIPAGTRILMAMTAPLNTVSATNESGLYMETASAVIEQNRVVIPIGTHVQGSVVKISRPGRVKGRAQVRLHFDKMILPNNYVVPISGSLAGLAGSHYEKKGSGSLQPVDQIDKDARTIFSSAGSGAAIGALAGGARGAWQGAAIGSAVGIGIALFKRGDDIHLETGTRLEMILDHDITIPVAKLDFPTTPQHKSLPHEPWQEN